MDRGLYIAASGMLAEQLRQDQIANDLANASTAGYKAERTTQQSLRRAAAHQLRHRPQVGRVSAPASRVTDRSDRLVTPSRAQGHRRAAGLRHQRRRLLRRADRRRARATRATASSRPTPQGRSDHARGRPRPRPQRPAGHASAPTARSTRARSTSSPLTNPREGRRQPTSPARPATSRARPPARSAPARSRAPAPTRPVHGGHDGLAARLRVRPEGHPDDRRDARQGRVAPSGSPHTQAPSPDADLEECSKDSEPPPPACRPSSRSSTPSPTTWPTPTPPATSDCASGSRTCVYDAGGRPTTSGDAQLGTGARAVHGGRTFEQGALQQTGKPTDVAHRGRGLHAGQARPTAATALTRDGDLHIDADGRLRHATSAAPQPTITIPEGHPAPRSRSASDGTVAGRGPQRRQASQLVNVRSPQNLAVRRRQRLRRHRRSGNAVAAPAATPCSSRARSRPPTPTWRRR